MALLRMCLCHLQGQGLRDVAASCACGGREWGGVRVLVAENFRRSSLLRRARGKLATITSIWVAQTVPLCLAAQLRPSLKVLRASAEVARE